MSDALYVVDGAGRKRFIGFVYGQTLHMTRKKSKHFFKKYKAWAIDKKSFDSRPDILLFILEDEESQTKYLATRLDFNKYSKLLNYDEHLPQLALPQEYWSLFK